jgi:hypothetical protein
VSTQRSLVHNFAVLGLLALAGCAGAKSDLRSDPRWIAANDRIPDPSPRDFNAAFPFAKDTRCLTTEAPFLTDVGCAIDEKGPERLLFQNDTKPSVELGGLQLWVDEKRVLISNDSLVLARDAFGLATFHRKGDYSLGLSLFLKGRRDGPLKGYIFHIKTAQVRSPNQGLLTARLMFKDGEARAEDLTVRWFDSSGQRVE